MTDKNTCMGCTVCDHQNVRCLNNDSSLPRSHNKIFEFDTDNDSRCTFYMFIITPRWNPIKYVEPGQKSWSYYTLSQEGTCL